MRYLSKHFFVILVSICPRHHIIAFVGLRCASYWATSDHSMHIFCVLLAVYVCPGFTPILSVFETQ